MNTQLNCSLNGIYLLNPQISSSQLSDAIHACLCKAEALAVTAATIDIESYTTEIIVNYLWAVSDIIREARWLYEKVAVI